MTAIQMSKTELRFSELYKKSAVYDLIQKEKEMGMSLSTEFIQNLADQLSMTENINISKVVAESHK